MIWPEKNRIFFHQAIALLLLLGLFNADANSQMQAKKSIEQINQQLIEKFKQGSYSKKGADTCLKCHDEQAELNGMGIFNNVHGRADISATPFAHLQCESCHGPVGKHAKRLRKGKEREPMVSFGMNSPVLSAHQSSVCLSCHDDQKRVAWQGSVHQSEQLPCSACHLVHTAQDPALIKQQQNKLCGSCHKAQNDAFNKRSAHPLKWGQMSCSDCHNPHGSMEEHGLVKSTLNQTCFQCHGEKRGPLLWEHAPVTEDCSICHNAHGSVNAGLLKQRAPQLCLDCHSPADHPVASAQQINNPNTRNVFVLGKNCLNCHSQVHGSNHPSGQMMQR